jgi:hypothetical protein
MCAVGWVMRDTMEVGLMLSALRMRLSAQRASFRYIETRDNRKRRHSPLGYVSPAVYDAPVRIVAQFPSNTRPHFRGTSLRK